MLYELLTGELPFKAQDPISLITQHLHDEVTPPRVKNPEIPKKLNALIISLLSKKKEDRPTCIQVMSELDSIVSPQMTLIDDGAVGSIPMFLSDSTELEIPKRPPFVAREKEISKLSEFLDSTLSRGGRTVFVAGGPGLGKTALVTEFMNRSMADYPNLLVAIGRCNAYSGNGDPFLPFRDIFSMLAGGVEVYWSSGAISSEYASRIWQNRWILADALISRGPDLIDVLVPRNELQALDFHLSLDEEKIELLKRKQKD